MRTRGCEEQWSGAVVKELGSSRLSRALPVGEMPVQHHKRSAHNSGMHVAREVAADHTMPRGAVPEGWNCRVFVGDSHLKAFEPWTQSRIAPSSPRRCPSPGCAYPSRSWLWLCIPVSSWQTSFFALMPESHEACLSIGDGALRVQGETGVTSRCHARGRACGISNTTYT